MSRNAAAVVAIAVLGLAAPYLWGCAAGPDFHRPAAPVTAGYTLKPLSEPGGSDQNLVQGQDVDPQWWTGFGSLELNALMARALKANPDLEAARAALRAARDNYLAQRGALAPTVGLDYNVTRQQASGTPAPPLASNNNLFTLHTAQVTVSYVPDVFGGVRRQTESAEAQAEQQRFETEATYLTLTTNVAAGAIAEASLAAQVEATRRVIKVEEDILAAMRRRKDLGGASGLDVATQEAAVAQAESTLPPLEKQLAQQRDQLAYLTGRTPEELTDPPIDLATLTLPGTLPVSLPSKLVEQRPDVRAAEAALHAASAQVGVAIAERFPAFALTAAAGGSATDLSNLFSRGNSFWSLAGDVAQPIFQGGSLHYRQKAAEAGLAQATAQYRGAVLAAFQNVGDTLQSLQADGRALSAAVRAEKSAETALTITRRQLEAGAVDRPAVLLAEQAAQQTVLTRLQAESARLADTVALYAALGGGWWNRHDG